MTFDFSVIGEHMPGDLRGPITYRHLGHSEIQALWDQKLVNDRDHKVVSREATLLEVLLLRHRGLIPPLNPDEPETIRAVLTWYGPLRSLNFTINGKNIEDTA